MGRMRFGHVALPVAALVVLAGATATWWLPALSDREGQVGQEVPDTDSPAASVMTVADAEPADLIRFGSKSANPRPAGSIRLATYNVENLFDDKDDPALSGSNEDKDQTKPPSALKGAAAALKALDADIVALEEVESLDALLWFRDNWLADLGYTFYASVDAGDERGIEQAVLSRFPITDVKNWPGLALEGVHPDKAPDAEAGTPLKLHRSPLKVDIVLGTQGATPQVLTLFVVHQKSGFKSAYWREAESKKIVELVKAEAKAHADHERPIAILGDFNATPDQASIKTYLDGGFVDLFADREAGNPAWITHESGRTIDLILGNQILVQSVVQGSHFVLGVPARPAGSDWRTTPPPEGYASDHYPVAVDLSFGGVTPPGAPRVEVTKPGAGKSPAGTSGGEKQSEHDVHTAGAPGGGGG